MLPMCLGNVSHPDGHIIHVFQHAREQTVSFGNNPVIVSRCYGRTCRLVQVDRALAMNWPTPENRSSTVVGRGGIEDVANVLAIRRFGQLRPTCNRRNLPVMSFNG